MRIRRLRPLFLAAAVAVPFVLVPAANAATICRVNGVVVTSGTFLVSGTPGNDLIDCSGSPDPAVIDAGAGNDRVVGSAFDDFIQGGPGNDSIDGRAGGDWIAGDEGNDALTGGPGNDRITGGNADVDTEARIPGSGTDFLDGGAGNDALEGGDGRDVLMGGPGIDNLSGPPNDGASDVLNGGADVDGCAGFIPGSSIGGQDPDVFSSCEGQRIDVLVGVRVIPDPTAFAFVF